MSKNDPAFPLTEAAIAYYNRDFPMQGLTKLEWFAGIALAELDMTQDFRDVAAHAFDLAEAMIAESEKRR